MSLFGAMSTAISGLHAQAAAFSNISDNMANSQTVGYKGIDTSFIDYLSTSSSTENQSGSVNTRPNYLNETQGTIQQSADPLALAISGQGFFAVDEQSGNTSTGQPIFNPQQFYTRAGDFTPDAQGFLVNSAGEFLTGWPANPGGATLNTSQLVPIQVAQTQFKPVPTTAITLQANVPSTPTATSNLTSETQIYDATGTAHQLTLTWSQTSTNNWTLTTSSPENTAGGSTTIGSVDVAFNTNGTLAALSNPTGALAINSTLTAGAIQISPNFGDGSQPITINLGSFNTPNGLTQYAGTDYTLSSVTQDGAPPGSFTGISMTQSGDVEATYNNGQSVRIAHVPLVTFEDANALQRQNGQSFTATSASGAAVVQNANQNGAGGLVTGSVESSNVDIATQLSKLIVAQQAYGANAKVITAAQQLLTTTIDMKQ